MDSQDVRCPNCGATMQQMGTTQGAIMYKCPYCGVAKMVQQSSEETNAVYWDKRAELFSRVRSGILNWQGTNWDYLYRDVTDFLSRYEESHRDTYFKMAVIACLTEGYNTMDKEKYKQCKAIFKVTEKCYKLEMREWKKAHDKALKDRISEYEEYRNMYRQCRSEYRNTKIYWKIIQFFFKSTVKFSV